MHSIRRSAERGSANYGWLDTRHTFSFGDYFDPRHRGFSRLRVINEDRVEPGKGFPTHPHRDMEIITYVLDGALEHRDSMGNGSVIRRGDVQRMSAGTGVTHSEYNHSSDEIVHFLQIWIHPDRVGLTPSYEQKTFLAEEKRGRLLLLASPDGDAGSVTIHQDARLYGALLESGERVSHPLAPDRRCWVHVARGELRWGEETLHAGDGLALDEVGSVELEGGAHPAEVLVFDLP